MCRPVSETRLPLLFSVQVVVYIFISFAHFHYSDLCHHWTNHRRGIRRCLPPPCHSSGAPPPCSSVLITVLLRRIQMERSSAALLFLSSNRWIIGLRILIRCKILNYVVTNLFTVTISEMTKMKLVRDCRKNS